MTNSFPSLLKAAITLHGDLSRPVPPGAVFATIPSETAYRELKGLAERPYPPILANNPGCSFDPKDLTLKSLAWGKVVFTKDGVRIRPSWKMSQDKMLLTVEVDASDYKGVPTTIGRIRSYLPHALEGIQQDLSFPAIEQALEESTRTGKPVIAIVAEGIFPEEGRDAILKLNFESTTAAGKLRTDGTMDFKERAQLHSVKEGDELGTLQSAVHGTFGYDLFGNPIGPRDVERIKISIGVGVKASPEEEGITTFTATKEGVVRLRNGILEVVDLLEINGDVDYTTGNVHAQNGSVRIRGDVKCGFKVECDGDVVIDGVVEEADISAGGLVIAGGVIMNGKNTITAKGDVSAHFFRNAIINAGGDVSADQEMAHCMVAAGGKVTVRGEIGIISGGHIISGDDIHATVIGSKVGVGTIVEIRVPRPEFDELDEQRQGLEEELKKLDRAIGVDFDLSSLMSAPEEDRRILAELIKVRGRIQADIRNILESKQRMIEDSQLAIASKRIKADRMVYPGTEIIISGKGYSVPSAMESPSFRLDLESREIAWK